MDDADCEMLASQKTTLQAQNDYLCHQDTPVSQILKNKIDNPIGQVVASKNCIQQLHVTCQYFSCIGLLKHLSKSFTFWLLKLQITKSVYNEL